MSEASSRSNVLEKTRLAPQKTK